MTLLLQGAGLQTAAAAPVPPLFDSAEVGNANASTVAVTFDQDVSAAGSDYSSGVTIKVNGSTRAFESGIRQANHAIVYYALSLAVAFGDVVTWEYVEASGNIVAEDDSTPLEDVTAQSVTNNVADTIGPALRLATVAYWKLDEASGARIDATGHGHDLTEVGTVPSISGKVGNAIAISTSNDLALKKLNDSSFQGFGKTLSFAFWFRLNSVIDPPADQTMFFRYSNGTPDYYASYTSNVFGGLSIIGFDDQGNYYCAISHSNKPTIGAWYFIYTFIDYENQTVGISVNDVLESAPFDSTVTPPVTVYSPSAISIGSEVNPLTPDISRYPCAGDIDEVGFWNRILTSDEVTYLYNSGAGRALFPAP